MNFCMQKKILWLHSIFLLSLKWCCWCTVLAFMSNAEWLSYTFCISHLLFSPQAKALKYQLLYLQLKHCAYLYASPLCRCLVTCVWSYSAVWVYLAGFEAAVRMRNNWNPCQLSKVVRSFSIQLPNHFRLIAIHILCSCSRKTDMETLKKMQTHCRVSNAPLLC